MSREREIADVAATLMTLLDEIEQCFEALNVLRGQPRKPPDDGSKEKRMMAQ